MGIWKHVSVLVLSTAIGATASAAIQPLLVEGVISAAAKSHDASLANARTYDLRVTVTDTATLPNPDSFVSAGINVTLDTTHFPGIQFYQNSFGGSNGTPPSPSLFTTAGFEQTAYDTFVSLRNFQAPSVLGNFPETQAQPVITANQFSVSFGDLSANSGSGTFTIARLTILNAPAAPPIAFGDVAGELSTLETGGTPVSFDLAIPEPTGLGLLSLACAALFARRRREP